MDRISVLIKIFVCRQALPKQAVSAEIEEIFSRHWWYHELMYIFLTPVCCLLLKGKKNQETKHLRSHTEWLENFCFFLFCSTSKRNLCWEWIEIKYKKTDMANIFFGFFWLLTLAFVLWHRKLWNISLLRGIAIQEPSVTSNPYWIKQLPFVAHPQGYQ